MSSEKIKNIIDMEKNIYKKIFEWISLILIVGFSIFSQIVFEEGIMYPWVSFVVQVPLTILMSLLTYNFLDFIFPPILFKDNDYKNHRITKTDKITYYLFLFLFILNFLFLLFISVMYIFNFQNPSGIYYLQLIQTSLFFSTVFYFFIDASTDYPGHAFCDFIQSNNQHEKIKKHFLPRTLTPEMYDLYITGTFSGI